MALEESSIHFIHVIISFAILLFAAKLFAELFHRLKLPMVLGELLAGIIVGPFAIGGLLFFNKYLTKSSLMMINGSTLDKFSPNSNVSG